MKELKPIIVLVLLSTCLLYFGADKSKNLQAGDVSFIGFSAYKGDSFAMVCMVDIPENSVIRFTDSEWNGNRFGHDESEITWHSGKNVIPEGTVICFSHLNHNPKVSNGQLKGTMKLSKESEAIFAYTGNSRMPETFLAAIANHHAGYGTLLNTGLSEGISAITLIDDDMPEIAQDDPNQFMDFSTFLGE